MFKKIRSTENKKTLINNFFSLLILRGFQFLVPLITLPYLVRTIGLDKFGLVNFALSFALYFSAIVQYGFGLSATREIARHRNDAIKLSNIYSATFIASALLAIISIILFCVIVIYVEKFKSYVDLYLYSMAFIVFQSLFPIWFYQGMEKMKYITFLKLSTSCMYLIGLLVFVKQEADFKIVPLLNAIAAFITLFISISLIKKQFKVRFEMPSFQDLKIVYKAGYHAFVSQLAPNLYNNTAVFLLGYFTNSTTVGVYTAATKIIDAFNSFAYIISSTFLPYLARSLQRYNTFQAIMLGSGIALTCTTYLSADWIVRLIFSLNNPDIVTYIKFLAISILMLFINMTYGANYLMLIGKEEVVKNIALYTSIIFFLIALVVIPIFEIWGAIVVLAGARTVIAILHYINYQKYNKVEYHK
ncbi:MULTISPECIES: oligosaccharide flippase family protein [unclassified Marinobacterium]|uniref:oligosaccharide flippase family protein n=1 Tax=unclassified Marinobacterium TaxID=2644139 RepID=UPI0015690A33|nr:MULTISPECIES: oligosaccharide flippase family protein [unclassified Marinobacterium]NRP09208.1 putative O-antigen transporter [Marinobacterium sp. xm-g-48]NRP82261.1 putative O-antigen transporter [Marinobacterium sp. xm-d-509]